MVVTNMELFCHQPAAKVAACLDHQDPMVRRANLANLENPELQVPLVHLANLQRHHAMFRLHHHANHARSDHQVLQDLQDRLVNLANPALLAALELTHHPDHLAHLVHQAHQDPKERKEDPAIKDRQLRLNHPFLANPATQEISDHPARKVHLAKMARMANLDLEVAKVPKVLPGHPVPMACPVHLAQLVLLARPARRVFVQNTAPWMVVSSSKMAQEGAKRFLTRDMSPEQSFHFYPFLFLLFIFIGPKF